MKQLLLILCVVVSVITVNAQNINLDSLTDAKAKPAVDTRVTHTFLSSRLVNGHSVESPRNGVLDFRISHRFGRVNEGLYNFFGLDEASMRIGLDYGITDRFSVGIGRSTFQKQIDGFLKYRLLWQTTDNSIPVSLTLLTSAMVQTLKSNDPNIKITPSDRWYFAHQLLLARKFGEGFSLQLMPTLIHYNRVPAAMSSNNFIALGAAARVRLTHSLSFNAEYYYNASDKLPGTHNSFSVGFDIETAGHVFQLHMTNSTGMTERTFITETDGQWDKGDIRFGFNISRLFNLKKHRY
ncbi:MAG: hypothetical protein JWN76_3717 [Chitinophagaceae bacterium]|nr:hypothetical protein [Chitinophagaceae bacterium]